MRSDESLKREVVKEFGEGVMTDDGQHIDRAKLGEIVFSDPSKRKILNGMTHKRIFNEIIRCIMHRRIVLGEQFVVLDAPLLFESKILEYFCYPIVVIAVMDEDKLLERLMNRDQSSREDALKRINA